MTKVNAFWWGVLVASGFWTVGVYAGKAVAYKVWDDIKAFWATWFAKVKTEVKADAAKV